MPTRTHTPNAEEMVRLHLRTFTRTTRIFLSSFKETEASQEQDLELACSGSERSPLSIHKTEDDSITQSQNVCKLVPFLGPASITEPSLSISSSEGAPKTPLQNMYSLFLFLDGASAQI